MMALTKSNSALNTATSTMPLHSSGKLAVEVPSLPRWISRVHFGKSQCAQGTRSYLAYTGRPATTLTNASPSFRLRSAPFIFNHFAFTLEWILHNNYAIKYDDYLLVGSSASEECAKALAQMLTVCEKLGFPVATDKLKSPSQIISFPGHNEDANTPTIKQTIAELMDLLHCWQSIPRKVTKRRLLSLIGKLSFAAKAVPAGRLFLRRLIDLSCTARRLHHCITAGG